MDNNKRNEESNPLLKKMPRLSSPIAHIKAHYDVVVIGSGYGGSISASRLARMGYSVCLLERGREIMPGDFPKNPIEIFRNTQLNLIDKHKGARSALFHIHNNKEIAAIVGMGLGGTSLINANVAEMGDSRVFDDDVWPEEFREDVRTKLEKGYKLAKWMLGSNTFPNDQTLPTKVVALRNSARKIKGNSGEYSPIPVTCEADSEEESQLTSGNELDTFKLLPINVTFEKNRNSAGITQPPCTMCGNCMTGCNVGAKNTTHMNYLPDAHKHGAEMYCEIDVQYVERKNGRWLVHYQPLNTGIKRFTTTKKPTVHWVSADKVILCAGTFGSTSILMRSKKHNLFPSEKLGHNFSGNGDMGGIGFNCDEEVGCISTDKNKEVGATIMSAIDLRDSEESKRDFEKGVIIEEGTFPNTAILSGRLMVLGMSLVSMPLLNKQLPNNLAVDTDKGDSLIERWRNAVSLVRGIEHGAMKNTQIYMSMAHDSAGGTLRLDEDRIRVEWPGLGDESFIQRTNELFEKATGALGGTFVKNPIWGWLLDFNNINRKMLTAHPLGGCIMGEDATKGVVNHKGQLFKGVSGDEVYEGLYVSDGSVIPRSIGINPLLTISAITERMLMYLADDHSKKIDYCKPSPPKQSVRNGRYFQMSEAMRGCFWIGADKHEQGFKDGKLVGSKIDFLATILIDDVDEMLKDPEYPTQFTGMIFASDLSNDPLMVTDGRLNLTFKAHEDPRRGPRLEYIVRMEDRSGRPYCLYGTKIKRSKKLMPLRRFIENISTLHITIHDGEDTTAPVLGKGIIRIKFRDLFAQVRSFKIKRGGGIVKYLSTAWKAGRIFYGSHHGA